MMQSHGESFSFSQTSWHEVSLMAKPNQSDHWMLTLGAWVMHRIIIVAKSCDVLAASARQLYYTEFHRGFYCVKSEKVRFLGRNWGENGDSLEVPF
jgi:hypothetical protein